MESWTIFPHAIRFVILLILLFYNIFILLIYPIRGNDDGGDDDYDEDDDYDDYDGTFHLFLFPSVPSPSPRTDWGATPPGTVCFALS